MKEDQAIAIRDFMLTAIYDQI